MSKTFVPHVECLGTPYGEVGTPTNYKDINGEPLFVGDVVTASKDGKGDWECTIVRANLPNGVKCFVHGLIHYCDDKTGTVGNGWQILKKRSWQEIENGEIVWWIKYVLMEEE